MSQFVKKPANRCYVCHVGKKRTHRNAYGALMEETLDWKKDAKDKEKILAAIKKAREARRPERHLQRNLRRPHRSEQVPRRRAGRDEEGTGRVR